VEMRFTGPRQSISTERWKSLCHQCRQAKESIFSEAAESCKITVMGKGSQLIAGTLSADLKREVVEETVLEGFFPILDADDAPAAVAARKGITEFGLPYEQEPAVTRQLGWFLSHHQKDVLQKLQRPLTAPDLILFNGGSLKPSLIQQRIRAALQHWFRDTDPEHPRVLENPDPDLAVAVGAAYYGLVKIGQGVRVGSGSPRAFYLGVARGEAPIRETDVRTAICVVERGLEEGSTIGLEDKDVEVLANQPVAFDLYSSSYRSGDRSGDLVEIDDTFTPLPPLQTVIQYGKKGIQKAIPAKIEAEYTEAGTLSLWCRSRISDHRWKLQFQLRDTAPQQTVTDKQILEASETERAQTYLREVFSDNDASRVEGLAKELSRAIDLPRDDWPLGLIRTLADELFDMDSARQRGPAFESTWLNLQGFCLRPGMGEGFDEQRIHRMWKIYQHNPLHAKHTRVRLEWWILWRRVAAGFTPGQQRQILQDVTPVLFGKKSDQKKITPQERLEIWMAVANMEKLYSKDKIKLGRQLLSETSPKKIKAQHLWALSRIGARELLYGPADRVVPPKEVSRWIEQLMGYAWTNPSAAGRALSQLARKTGDRARDLEDRLQTKILEWMDQNQLPEELQRPVREVVSLARQEQTAMFGESLPSGIILKRDYDQ
jgi:hypothetical protein